MGRSEHQVQLSHAIHDIAGSANRWRCSQVCLDVLICRVDHEYPEQAAAISIKDVHQLPVADKRRLSKALHRLADEHAAREEVCAFNLVEACQVCFRSPSRPSYMHACVCASSALQLYQPCACMARCMYSPKTVCSAQHSAR